MKIPVNAEITTHDIPVEGEKLSKYTIEIEFVGPKLATKSLRKLSVGAEVARREEAGDHLILLLRAARSLCEEEKEAEA